jgi:hypothetical protein
MRVFNSVTKSRLAALLLVLAGGILLLLNPAIAFAHEDRDIAGGKYQFRVGFVNEPVYQGLDNAVYLAVCNGKCVGANDGSGGFTNGLSGAFDTLKVEVIYGKQSVVLNFRPVPRSTGRYNAEFIPTRVGDYTFRIFGNLGTDKIDERFTSSPETFDSVQSQSEIQFPDKPGFPAVLGQSSQSIGAATPGTTAAPTVSPAPVATAAPPISNNNNPAPALTSADLTQLRQQLEEQKQQLVEARTAANSASSLAIGGLVVGIIGGVVGLAALFLGMRASGTGKPGREPEGG